MSACPRGGELIKLLDDWYASPLGSELAALEQECLDGMLRGIFGHYLLQVGIRGGFADAVSSSRIRRPILLPLAPCRGELGVQAAARPEQLPVASDSVDAVFLPHTLDFALDAHEVLREVERVLIPEGRVLVMGFNAFSLWGLWHLVRKGQGSVPWCGHFFTPFRIIDWLSLLGFDVEAQEMMMFRPPWRRAWLRDLSFLDSMGSRFWPLLGGVYAIRAVKRVSTLTPIKPGWRARRPVICGGAVEPTTRESGHARLG